jgi:TetR/AcrR family transcriptional repressor of mexJK operon
LVTAPEAVALNRLLTSATGASPKLVQLFWDAGPQRIQAGFQQFLRQEVAAGRLQIGDVARASAQFFALLKGELHARLLCGCGNAPAAPDLAAHVRASVEMFLRAYAPHPDRAVAL